MGIPPGFVRCVKGRLFSNYVLYFSYPDVFNDVAWLDSKLNNVTVGKRDGSDCDDLPRWRMKKDYENLTRNSQTTG